jgi:HPt (histidine-containing phosphotransfer) domain-containing protein
MSRAATDGVLDLEQLRALSEMVEGPDDLPLRALYEVFADDARRSLERMRELLRCGDAKSLAREAHRLKGSSGTIGAAGLSRGCRDIEFCAKQAGEDLERRIDHAQRQLEAALNALREYC